MTSDHKIIFRSEQQDAISRTVACLRTGHRMLWNAKMRFGKTLCALEVARRCGYRRTLILTHRPNVRAEWYVSLERLGLTDWLYGGKRPAMADSSVLSFEDLEARLADNPDLHYVYFASMQDLRGSKRVNLKKGFEKNNNIFSAPWDLLIVDEAHEGVISKLGEKVIAELQKRHSLRTLYLSGTPYNIQQMFDNAEVYHWDYAMEQKAKQEWTSQHPGQPNPYEGMARMNILTYNLSRDFRSFHSTDADGFAFSEFFRTETAEGTDPTTDSLDNLVFAHEKDVRRFLQLIGQGSQNKLFPYANKDICGSLLHTLWYLPGVKEAYCLAKLLREDTLSNPFRGYTVVNVAGNLGDERQDAVERARSDRDALQRVREAVAANDRTITLTCGRLTAGVSVPEWTAVLMLAGSAETGGMRYFQTIFRCQSPYAGDRVKEECYAIDFSPRRTLAVVDQYVLNNVSSSSEDDRNAKLAEFLRFCPITEISASKQSHYDTELFIRNVTSVYSESLIRNGFRDDCLYGNLDNLRKQDLRVLDQIAEAIVRGIATERQRNREMVENAKNGGKRKTRKSAAEKKAPADNRDAKLNAAQELTRRLTPRQRAIAILNQISSRFPIMIYGTVESIEGLTLDSFINGIDADSWKEFMPTGITVRLFNKLKRFYREDIFVATAKVIVERLRKADNMTVGDRMNEVAAILGDFCYPDRETILTPWRTINSQMADTLGGYCFFDDRTGKPIAQPRFVYNGDVTERVFMKPGTRILDICSKTGLYALYAAYSVYKSRSSQSQGLFDMLTDEESLKLWKDILENNIFAVCRTHIAEKITRRTLLGYRKDICVNVRRVDNLVPLVMVYKNRLARMLSDGPAFWNKNDKEMKFDAIIGNPPYQLNIGEQKDNYGIPLYNQFLEVARDMGPSYISMIMPSRWFTGGRGLDAFRRDMLADCRFRAIVDYVDSKDLFPTVDISGGVNYFLWDARHNSPCRFTNTFHGKTSTCDRSLNQYAIFVRNNDALSIVNKVTAVCGEDNLSTQVTGQTPFGFVTTYRGTADPETDRDVVALKSTGPVTYVRRDEIRKNQDMTDLYKVVFSKATCEHAGTPDRNGMFRVLSAMAILPPATICTQTYLVGGAYKTEVEAKNLYAFLSTKFARFLMLQTITSQDLSPEKFIFVPKENFTSSGDISWTPDDIPSIDRQLYAKYGITEEEVALIERTVKEM